MRYIYAAEQYGTNGNTKMWPIALRGDHYDQYYALRKTALYDHHRFNKRLLLTCMKYDVLLGIVSMDMVMTLPMEYQFLLSILGGCSVHGYSRNSTYIAAHLAPCCTFVAGCGQARL